MPGRPELPARRSTVEKVIAPEKLGARVVVAALLIKLLVKVRLKRWDDRILV